MAAEREPPPLGDARQPDLEDGEDLFTSTVSTLEVSAGPACPSPAPVSAGPDPARPPGQPPAASPRLALPCEGRGRRCRFLLSERPFYRLSPATLGPAAARGSRGQVVRGRAGPCWGKVLARAACFLQGGGRLPRALSCVWLLPLIHIPGRSPPAPHWSWSLTTCVA